MAHPQQQPQPSAKQSEYLQQCKAEKDNLDPSVFVHATRLLTEEIDRVERGIKYTEVHNEKKTKLASKVIIPVKEFPKFNFVGKLLGPAGNSLKRLQQETGCKMSILGMGSMRDKSKEAQMRKEADAKNFHLNEELHVLVEVFAPPIEAFHRMTHAHSELRKFLIPEFNDEIRAQQLEEMMYINGDEEIPAHPHPHAHGHGPPPMRGAPRGRGGPPRGRGAPRGGPLLATPVVRGAGAPRGIPRGGPPRGGPAPRGLANGRGRGMPPARAAPSYGGEDYSYGGAAYESSGYEYAEQGYESNAYGGQEEQQYFDYGGGQTAAESYDDGYGESYSDPWASASSFGKAPPPVGRVKTEGFGRPHPYSAASGRGSSFGGSSFAGGARGRY